MKQRNGQRHIEWLHGLGLLGPTCSWSTAAVTEAERDLIAAGGHRGPLPGSATCTWPLARPGPPHAQPGHLGGPGHRRPGLHNSQDLLETMKGGGPAGKKWPPASHSPAARRVLRIGDHGRGAPVTAAGPGPDRTWRRADLTLVNLNTSRSMRSPPDSAVVYNASAPTATRHRRRPAAARRRRVTRSGHCAAGECRLAAGGCCNGRGCVKQATDDAFASSARMKPCGGLPTA